MNSKPFGSLLPRRDFMTRTFMAGAGTLAVSSWALGDTKGTPGSSIDDIQIGIVRAVCDIWDYARKYAVNKLKQAGVAANGYIDIEDAV